MNIPVRRQRALPDCASLCTISRICPPRWSCALEPYWKAARTLSGFAVSSIGICTCWQKWQDSKLDLSLPTEPAALAISRLVLASRSEREQRLLTTPSISAMLFDRCRFAAARIARLANCAGQPPVVSRRNHFFLPELMEALRLLKPQVFWYNAAAFTKAPEVNGT